MKRFSLMILDWLNWKLFRVKCDGGEGARIIESKVSL